MVSGSTVYREIRGKISTLESNLNGLGKKLSDCENSITKSMNEREDCYSQLAAFYLPELDAASLRTTLREIQNDVKRIFVQKQTRRQELEEIMGLSQAEKRKYEAELDKVTEKLNGKVGERERLSKIVLGELRKDNIYTELKSKAKEADKQLVDCHKRVKEIEKDAVDKLPAYETNKLFMYLLDRSFGDSSYDKHGLVAKLDVWVAKIVNYDERKQFYDFLHSVPEIMKEEVQKREKSLGNLVRMVQRIEKEYSDKNGLTKVVGEGTKLGQEREKLLKYIEDLSSKYSAAGQERRNLDSTKDDYYIEAISRLKDYLKGNTIEDLKEKALGTKERTDDNLVEQIEEIDSNIKDLKIKAKNLKTERDSAEEKLDGLKAIQQKYSHAEYESGRSHFTSSFDINSLLVGYLAGKYSQNDLWHDISHSHHFEPAEESYHSSYSSSSYHSSGSFSSGGGFGGGGFSSGGGF